MTSAQLNIEAIPGGVTFDVKAVPGGSRDQIVGLLGTALKVKVSAAPEDGKANAAVCRLLAAALGVPTRSVTVTAGHTRPQKRIAVAGLAPAQVLQLLGLERR